VDLPSLGQAAQQRPGLHLPQGGLLLGQLPRDSVPGYLLPRGHPEGPGPHAPERLAEALVGPDQLVGSS
jgi:hypothetical protein